MRSILAGSTTLLALASVTPSVAALTVATIATTSTAEWPSLTLALAEEASGRSMRPLLLDVGSGDDLGGEVKPFAEVVEALGGQGVVVPLPGELGLDIAAGVERLASLDDEEVLGINVGVLREVEVLGSHEHTLTEEVLSFMLAISQSSYKIEEFAIHLVDLLAVGLGNQHRRGLLGEFDVEL